MFKPKIIELLRRQGYTLSNLKLDLLSGLTVSIIALPLSIALAIASGATPEQGIITAVIAGFLISLLGGSLVQIGGPTGAFVVIVYQIIMVYGYLGLLISTFMAGIILIAAGFFKLGNLIKYISKPVIMGFTAGIAVIIFTAQIEYILGLSIKENIPADFLNKILVYYQHINSFNIRSLALTSLLIAVFIYLKRYHPKAPSFLLIVIFGSIINYSFGMDLKTIGSKFGHLTLSLGLSDLVCISNFKINDIIGLIPSAIIIAVLAGVESLLSAIVADSSINDRHNSNTELIGLGIANLFSSIFGGLPATGAIARTAANIKSGAKTPLAGIFHSIFVFVIAYALSDFLGYIPLCTLAAILAIVAYYMSDIKEASYLIKYAPKEDKIIFFTTFVFTIITDLTIGVTLGFIISMFVFISSMSNKLGMSSEPEEKNTALKLPEGVKLISFSGPMFFGTSHRIYDAIDTMGSPKVIIVDLTRVYFLDITASYILKELFGRFSDKYTLILSIKHSQERELLKRMGIKSKLKSAHIVTCSKEAVDLARAIVRTKSR